MMTDAKESVPIESAILDLLCDGDGDLHVGDALTVLLHIVAGLCCQATSQRPVELATVFAMRLRQVVADQDNAERTLQ